jgi:hypothetical protein
MTSVNEAIQNPKGPIATELAAGVDFLSGGAEITFLLYKKLVLPMDGFVFWVRSNLAPPLPIEPDTVNISGSLHYSTEIGQEQDATIAYNTIVFTALAQIDLFQQLNPQYIYLATYQGIRFYFSSQGKYYQQAGLWHYLGVAVTSVMNIQIIDDLSQFPGPLIITNSLPIWLAMPTYVPPYPGFRCPITLYPSFLVPQNEPPPYGTVHIEDTRALAEVATLGSTLTSNQLVSETVKITTYGVNNDTIITFLNFVTQYIYDWYFIGLMNMPIISDVKREQADLQVIAQKKEIEFKISYLQKSVRDIARQHILGCIVYSEANIDDINSDPAEIVVRPVIPPPFKFNAKARAKIAESLHVRS